MPDIKPPTPDFERISEAGHPWEVGRDGVVFRSCTSIYWNSRGWNLQVVGLYKLQMELIRMKINIGGNIGTLFIPLV
jgi:hypothetical protein